MTISLNTILTVAVIVPIAVLLDILILDIAQRLSKRKDLNGGKRED